MKASPATSQGAVLVWLGGPALTVPAGSSASLHAQVLCRKGLQDIGSFKGGSLQVRLDATSPLQPLYPLRLAYESLMRTAPEFLSELGAFRCSRSCSGPALVIEAATWGPVT
ncbi:hypothetical protein ABBQ38_006733 [Trebouxia sp. C0009 RCD-2024]